MTQGLALDRNLVLAAGAGSGKTHTLVTLAMALYAGGPHGPAISPESLWIVTFTEKAARELSERILTRAKAIAGLTLEQLREREPEFVALTGGSPDPTRWEAVIAAQSQAPIGTFHGLCARLLREWDDEGQQRILDDGEAGELLAQTMERVLGSTLEQEGPESLELIELVAALGRLEDLRRAIDTLIRIGQEEGTPAAGLLDSLGPADEARQGLERACGRLAIAIEGLLDSTHPRLELVTAPLRSQRDRLSGCSVETLETWYPIVASAMDRPRGRGSLPAQPKARFDRLRDAWEQVVLAYARREEGRLAAGLAKVVDAVELAYRARKRQLSAYDFADLVRGVRDRLVAEPERLAEVRERIAFLLVDECQDTNAIQFDLITLLCAAEPEVAVRQPIFDRAIAPRSFGAVGDRKQSIYEFRGADVSLFRTLMDNAIESPDFRLTALRNSYRSTPRVVRACNELFAGLMSGANPASFEVRWRESDALAPVRPDQDHVQQPVVVLEGLAGTQPRTDPEQVADFIASMLADAEQGVAAADVAILLRAHRHAAAYAHALGERGVASVVSGGRGFFEAVEVQHALALLVTLYDPDDALAVAIVVRSALIAPQPNVDWDAELATLGRDMTLAPKPEGEGRRARERLGAQARRRVQRIADVLDGIRSDSLADPVASLERAMLALQVQQTIAATEGARQRLANVGKLLVRLERADPLAVVDVARRWLTLGARTLSDGPAEPGLDWPADGDEGVPDAVRILTIHASKGLEFPVVVVPELGRAEPPERGAVIFARGYGVALRIRDPAGRVRTSEAGLSIAALRAKRRHAESLRLLYVACTRARDRLILAGRRRDEDAAASDWRALIDGQLGALDGVVDRVAVPTFEIAAQQAMPAQAASMPREISLEHVVAPRMLVELTVTQCADLLHCERRFTWTHVDPVADLGDPLDRAASFGAFAHRVLEVIDPAEAVRDPHLAVEAAARGLGHRAAREPGRDAVIRRLGRFVAFPEPQRVFAVGAAESRRLLRELPFVLRLEPDVSETSDQLGLFRPAAPAAMELRVRGQVDLLVVADDGGVEVIDYKLGAPHDAYRGQMALYARAAAGLWTEAAQRGRVRSALWSIGESVGRRRDPDRPQAVVPEELEAVSAQLLSLAGRHAARQRRRDHTEIPRLARPDLCGRCRFFERCWGRPRDVELGSTPP